MTADEIIRKEILDHELRSEKQAEKAQAYLTAGDYSAAATACHRAHQERQQATALYIVLGQLQ